MRFLLSLLIYLLPAGAQNRHERLVDSIIPWLTYNSSCSSTIVLQNLGDREVAIDLEGHKSTGALVPMTGHKGNSVTLSPGERAEFKLEITEETDGAWIRVREKIPSPQLSPVLAASGATDCLAADKLSTTNRDLAWPLRNPWFSADVKTNDDGTIALINASDRPASVSACYSSGSLYSVPHNDQPTELTPLCSDRITELVPPFGTRQFPVARGGNSHFSLKTRGDSIVLEMLRPSATGGKSFRVDSTITFEQEVPGR